MRCSCCTAPGTRRFPQAGPLSRFEQAWIQRERDNPHDVDRSGLRAAMIDQHIAIRNVCDRHDHGGNEKQDLCLGVEPPVADRLRVCLAPRPVRGQVSDLDCSSGNVNAIASIEIARAARSPTARDEFRLPRPSRASQGAARSAGRPPRCAPLPAGTCHRGFNGSRSHRLALWTSPNTSSARAWMRVSRTTRSDSSIE